MRENLPKEVEKLKKPKPKLEFCFSICPVASSERKIVLFLILFSLYFTISCCIHVDGSHFNKKNGFTSKETVIPVVIFDPSGVSKAQNNLERAFIVFGLLNKGSKLDSNSKESRGNFCSNKRLYDKEFKSNGIRKRIHDYNANLIDEKNLDQSILEHIENPSHGNPLRISPLQKKGSYAVENEDVLPKNTLPKTRLETTDDVKLVHLGDTDTGKPTDENVSKHQEKMYSPEPSPSQGWRVAAEGVHTEKDHTGRGKDPLQDASQDFVSRALHQRLADDDPAEVAESRFYQYNKLHGFEERLSHVLKKSEHSKIIKKVVEATSEGLLEAGDSNGEDGNILITDKVPDKRSHEQHKMNKLKDSSAIGKDLTKTSDVSCCCCFLGPAEGAWDIMTQITRAEGPTNGGCVWGRKLPHRTIRTP